MSGIEIVILVGAGIYITRKVKDSRERKRLEKQAAHNAAHGIPQIVEPTNENQTKRSSEDDEALPLYMPPSKEAEHLRESDAGGEVNGESSAMGIRRNQVAVEGEEVSEEADAVPPPSYEDIVPPASSRSPGLTPQQSAQTGETVDPATEKKMKRLSRPKFSFHRSSKSQDTAEA